MKTKTQYILTSLMLVCSIIYGQTIDLHSITTERDEGFDSGYTLDGNKMTQSRLKLLNQANFGPGGIYPKKINIIDSYRSSNSLSEVTKLPANDLFFFGTFNNWEAIEPFTPAEIDSLYNWSKRGGKLIITSGLYSTLHSYYSNMLNQKWGYKPINGAQLFITGEPENYNLDIINGPFGGITYLAQAGGLQGYFFKVTSPDFVVLAKDYSQKPTLIMSCKTLDVLVADVDVYTDEPGLVSDGPLIKNDNDRFLANTIVFMDRLQSPPSLIRTENELSVNSNYLDYTWYRNGEVIEGEKGNSIAYTNDGTYQVEVKVNGGCLIKSEVVDFDPECEIFVPTAFSPDGNGTNDRAYAYSACVEEVDFKIFNRWGELVFETTETNKGWDGRYKGAKAAAGVYGWSLNAKRKSGSNVSKKGNITLIR